MKIAIEGCAHGELENIYNTLTFLENKEGVKVDLLICCGDFQSTRNLDDLQCMAVPAKYKDICTFYKYYTGELIAPMLTLFIGGNHEASNYLQELAYGGWVAPKIYYMGYASVVKFGGLRIAGLSGIYKGHDYMKGHFEKPPYSKDTMRSVYHVRNVDVFRLKQVKQPLDIILSHDWPRGVYNHGNVQQLLKKKPFFLSDIEANALGSKPCEELLFHLKPSYWFAAHLHCKFAALVSHDTEKGSEEGKHTKFLALDKCLPRRQFLQIVDIPHDEQKPLLFEYDLEWLTILHFTNHLLSVKKVTQYMPGPGQNGRWIFTPTEEEMNTIFKRFGNDLVIPENFAQTATAYDPDTPKRSQQPQACLNPQTMGFCEKLGIDDPMALVMGNTDISLDSSSLNDTFASFLSPGRPGDLTTVSPFSSQDSSVSYQDSVNTSTDFDSPRSIPVDSTDFESPRPFPIKRLNMTLPSPKLDSQESLIGSSQESDESSLSKSSLSLPSPIAICVQEQPLEEPILSPRKSLCLPSPKTESDAKPEVDLKVDNRIVDMGEKIGNEIEGAQLKEENTSAASCVEDDPVTSGSDTQPLVKKFKRRNQSMYSNTDDE